MVTAPSTKGQRAVSEIETVKVLNRHETAAHLGISFRTFTRMEARGEAPPKVRLSPGRVGFLVRDLQAWQDARREVVS